MSVDQDDPRTAIEREIFVRSMAMGRPPSRDNTLLGDAMQEVTIEAGQALYREGAPSDYIYFVIRGMVELQREGFAPRRMTDRSIVGILDASQERPYERTAMAVTDVEALVLRNDDRLDMLEDSFEYTREIILATAASLQQLSLELPSGGFSEPDTQGPAPEREALPVIERVLTLREVAAFDRASIQALVSLAAVADEIRVGQGDSLFRAGEVTGVFYVVARGLIELVRTAPPGSARFGPASIVGGIPALGDAERVYAGRALRDSVLLRIREVDFFDVLEDHFDLARSVLAFIASERVKVVDEIERRKGQREP
jgi:CRP-like cAMP-binding protein